MKKVNPDSPPPKPADSYGCTCVWTLLDYGWSKGDDRDSCAQHGEKES